MKHSLEKEAINRRWKPSLILYIKIEDILVIKGYSCAGPAQGTSSPS
jgi:hypothetical protein